MPTNLEDAVSESWKGVNDNGPFLEGLDGYQVRRVGGADVKIAMVVVIGRAWRNYQGVGARGYENGYGPIIDVPIRLGDGRAQGTRAAGWLAGAADPIGR